MEKRLWSIELCERPVHLLKQVDRILFGKDLAHPFLVLLDDKDIVRGEIHMIPYDRTAINGISRLSRIFQRCQAFATPVGCDIVLRSVVQYTRWKNAYPVLHSRFYEAARQHDIAIYKKSLLRAPQDRVMASWEQLTQAALRLDSLNLPYDRFGWGRNRYNCQTGIASILAAAGLKSPTLSNRLAVPGWKVIPLNAANAANSSVGAATPVGS